MCVCNYFTHNLLLIKLHVCIEIEKKLSASLDSKYQYQFHGLFHDIWLFDVYQMCRIFPTRMSVGRWQNKNKNNSKLQTYFENKLPCLSHALVYTRLWVRHAYKSEVLSEAKFGGFIDVMHISRYQFYESFSFLPPLRHDFVVNISRVSISFRNVSNKIDCIKVKRKILENMHSIIHNIYIISE